MPCELPFARRLAIAIVPLVLAACGSLERSLPARSADDLASPSAAAEQSAVPPTTGATEAPSLTATAAPSAGGQLYVNEAQGWSVVVPAGWELVAENEPWMALSGDDAIAEIGVLPSSGLTLRELEAQKVDELLSSWSGVDAIESDLVRLPAGQAVRVTLESTSPDINSPVTFTLYLIEEGGSQYAISVRGPQDRAKVIAAGEALAESFAILD